MANLEQLVAGHAYWSDRRKELKQLGILEIIQCNGPHLVKVESHSDFLGHHESYMKGKNCIEHAHDIFLDELNCHDEEGLSFNEIWNKVGGWEPCEHCKKVRELKALRVKAGRTLGSIRGAMTRIGRTIDYDKKGDK